MGNEYNPCQKSNINDGFEIKKPNFTETIKAKYQNHIISEFILENLSFFKKFHLIAVILSTQAHFDNNLQQYKQKVIKQSKIFLFKQKNDSELYCQSSILLNFEDGQFYIGCLKNSQKEKKGFLIDKNGNIYDGQFKNNLPCGKGKWKSFYPKIQFQGYWVQGMREGQGQQLYYDGSFYIGNYQKDKKNGKGKLKISEQRVFEGQFKNGVINGYGILKNRDLQVKGYWSNGKLIQSSGFANTNQNNLKE